MRVVRAGRVTVLAACLVLAVCGAADATADNSAPGADPSVVSAVVASTPQAFASATPTSVAGQTLAPAMSDDGVDLVSTGTLAAVTIAKDPTDGFPPPPPPPPPPVPERCHPRSQHIHINCTERNDRRIDRLDRSDEQRGTATVHHPRPPRPRPCSRHGRGATVQAHTAQRRRFSCRR